MNNKIIKNNNGFTLIETMVAVIILTFTIAVFMNVVSNNYFYGKYARNEITANYLLQEVVDYIKNKRDEVVVFSADSEVWGTFIGDYSYCTEEDPCSFDYDLNSAQATISHCDNNCPLYYHESTNNGNFYNLTESGIETSFVRTIFTESNNNNNQLDVTVRVSWTNGTQEKSKELKTSIMNW